MEISSENLLGGIFRTAKRSHESDIFSVTLNHQGSAKFFHCWMQHSVLRAGKDADVTLSSSDNSNKGRRL
jgi:hypothetical protein